MANRQEQYYIKEPQLFDAKSMKIDYVSFAKTEFIVYHTFTKLLILWIEC